MVARAPQRPDGVAADLIQFQVVEIGILDFKHEPLRCGAPPIGGIVGRFQFKKQPLRRRGVVAKILANGFAGGGAEITVSPALEDLPNVELTL